MLGMGHLWSYTGPFVVVEVFVGSVGVVPPRCMV
jgi:hypothetical protein